MKTSITKCIENALQSYSPTQLAGIELNKFRPHTVGYEILASAGDVKGGIVDCLRVDETKKEKDAPLAMLITCFEIKISQADFHSNNGHNFFGNANYYVMPTELYKAVKKEIPDGVGVITYYDYKLKKVKECDYREVSDRDRAWVLLNLLKGRHEKIKTMY